MFVKSIITDPEQFPCTDRYPFDIPSMSRKNNLRIFRNITFFTGHNGSGKSTLLEALARKTGLLPWGGVKTHSFHANHHESSLFKYISVQWDKRKPYGSYFRAEAFFNFASSLDDICLDDPGRISYFGGTSLNTLSHGESFLRFFNGYSFRLDGLYIIDEPEAALDHLNQVEFVKILRENTRNANKQYFISTLSPVILACPDSQIFHFDDQGIKPALWQNTDSYKFYSDFLKDPNKFFN